MTEPFVPLWRYEIPVSPNDLQAICRCAQGSFLVGSPSDNQLVAMIQAANHAQAIPALRAEAKEAAKIVRAAESALDHDPVNHPRHYTFYKGVEIIDLTEQMNFNRGNAVKYIARAGIKDQAYEIQDLLKAAWYINREIARLQKQADKGEKSEGS